jgi:hypothetical protein
MSDLTSRQFSIRRDWAKWYSGNRVGRFVTNVQNAEQIRLSLHSGAGIRRANPASKAVSIFQLGSFAQGVDFCSTFGGTLRIGKLCGFVSVQRKLLGVSDVMLRTRTNAADMTERVEG